MMVNRSVLLASQYTMVKYSLLTLITITSQCFLLMVDFTGRRQFGAPRDVAVTSNDELLVVDWDDNCIYRYTLDGGKIIYHSNELLVGGCDNHCIYRFTLDGDYIGKLSNHGDELHQPESITIDPNGFILVGVIIKL